jgi:large subunit ribosomal protein L29
MQYNVIQKKSQQELFELINELKAELFLLRFKNKTGQQDQTHKIKMVRRDIAKALTALKNIDNPSVIVKKETKKVASKPATEKKSVKTTKDKEVK